MTIEERNTARAIQDIAKELKEIRKESDRIKIIAWEERRYEIARDVLSAFMSNPAQKIHEGGATTQAICAIAYADALIEELKKK